MDGDLMNHHLRLSEQQKFSDDNFNLHFVRLVRFKEKKKKEEEEDLMEC